ncbi:protein arginine N-methyltransferase [Chloropicon primus]|nr:protein arginine N-methyltransferase [Chloropicon primus]
MGFSGKKMSREWDGVVTEVEDVRYFAGYSTLERQLTLLSDRIRISSYNAAILGNADNFAGRVVLDVGCGTGILSAIAARAGAKKVYAVEATDAVEFAKKLMVANNLDDVVTVYHNTVEKLELPEKVDIIVSEFMGNFLLRESVMDSVLFARDKFLKSDGAMYPSHCKMFFAPVYSERLAEDVWDTYHRNLKSWEVAAEVVFDLAGFDIKSLAGEYEDSLTTGLRSSFGVEVEPPEMLGPAVVVKEIDMLTTTFEDVKQVKKSFELKIDHCVDQKPPKLNMFAGWFSASFKGSPFAPSLVEVNCNNSPLNEDTHWGQEGFLVREPLDLTNVDKILCEIDMSRTEKNWRMYDVRVTHQTCSTDGKLGPQLSTLYTLC